MNHTRDKSGAIKKKEVMRLESTSLLLKYTDNQIYYVLLSQKLRVLHSNNIVLKIYGIFSKNVQVFLIV